MTFETEHYGRFEIRSGQLSGAWGASAIRHKVIIARAAGATREAAVAELKVQLDDLQREDLSDRDREGAPSARVYERAFARLLPDLPGSYIAMLRAHLAASDRLISATKLAEAAGYAGYEGANLHYGKLGQKVAEEIGFEPSRRDDGTEIWTCAIARDPSLDTEDPDTSMSKATSRTIDERHFEWQMRPQVVEALRALAF